MRILFMEGFTSRREDGLATDATGYGITCCEALKNYLSKAGHQLTSISGLVTHPLGGELGQRKLAYTIRCYQKLLELRLAEYDVIFIFHIFQQFPMEIKKILFSLGKKNLPIVGYTHGSHWDPTDVYRTIHFPGFQIVDLACLHSLNRILVVSKYMRQVLFENIARFNPQLGEEIQAKIKVVGLPINPALMDAFTTRRKFHRLTIIFNHAFIPSKNPELFLRVMRKIFQRYDVNLVLTRKIPPGSPGAGLAQKLREKYRGRVFLGSTLPLDKYYRLLWMSDIQVSTATHESLGIATLEAMYTKNCCLLPDACCYPELTENYRAVLYPYREEELFKKLSWFIEHKEQRQEVAEKLHLRSLEFTPEKVGEKVSKSLEEVVRFRKG